MSKEFINEEVAANARSEFRLGKNVPTFGLCPGFLQANIVIIPSQYADLFLEFCNLNPGPCPLLYKSKVGEVGIPEFAKESDIRTDLPEYKVYKGGALIDTTSTLTDYNWNDLVTFYLGCSFSFDDKLIACGIKLKNLGKIVAMYVSNIECVSVPPFSTKMVVSMRPILKSQLQLAVDATINHDYCHGAPIHIGCPSDIGVYDFNSGLGSPIELSKDEVPVFWACGVTSQKAVQHAKLSLSFSHSPGKMFVADMRSDDLARHISIKTYPKAKVVCLDEKLQRYSLVSDRIYTLLGAIEKLTSEDLGNRNIAQLLIKEDFHKACLSLSKNCHSVAIILGFPLFELKCPSEENDGIAGAVYMANALLNAGKKVTFFVDSFSETLKRFLISSVIQKESTQVLSIGTEFTEDNFDFIINKETGMPKYTHIIAIERPSTSIQGGYRTMKGRSINCDPLDKLFNQGNNHSDIITIGIGDGGNEVGMGKVRDKVILNVPYGNEIATNVSCDYLITCGVSNWGGLALAAGMYAITQCPVHERFRRNGIGHQNHLSSKDSFIPDNKKDELLHRSIAEWNFCDGITGYDGLTVDGLDYFQVHSEKLKALHLILNEL
ncbi:D-glutamate cyclase, mitochondrial [Hydra vulgaris]|uniref:D-glutamate cyclase, mitochondrial n=1 Tax=Hydra vulgaris TaxID=6087 RepID=A0ABM4BQQ5_HYDVU